MLLQRLQFFFKGKDLREINIPLLEELPALKKHRGFGRFAFFPPASYELAKEIRCGVDAITSNQSYLDQRRMVAGLGG